jgi:hypothetical protein
MLGTAGQNLQFIQTALLAIAQSWELLLWLVFLQLLFATLIAWLLEEAAIGDEVLPVLCFLGGILGFSLLGLVAISAGVKPDPQMKTAGLVLGGIILLWKRDRFFYLLAKTPPMLVLFISFVFLLRLIFIQDLIVPSYADSLTHLQIVLDFMAPEKPPEAFFKLNMTIGNYYHFGFHAVVAWLSGITETDPVQGILILGQYFQALCVLSIYPLAILCSRNKHAAWIAMSIAAFFLPTPAHASNWGKYPALASMIGIAFVLAFLLVILNHPRPPRRFWAVLGMAAVSTFLLHSRSPVILLLLVLVYFVCLRSESMFTYFKVDIRHNENFLSAVMLLTVLLLLFLMLLMVLDIHPVVAGALFAVIAIVLFVDKTLTAILIVFFFLVTGFLSFFLGDHLLPQRFGAALDRPYISIFLYQPVSILLGMGIAAGIKWIVGNNAGIWFAQASRVIVAAGIAYAILVQSHLPSPCCIFVKDDDLFAYIWMKSNIPDNTLVGIAATGETGNLLPADGGAWIEHFTGIPTRKIDSGEDFIETHWRLCRERVTFFYLDDLENSFDEYNLIEASGLHQLSVGNVRIYSLDCSFLE